MVEGPMTEPVVTDGDGPAASPGQAAKNGRRPLKRSTRIALLVVLAVAVLATAAFLTYYFLDTRNYVSTDNAQVDGSQIVMNAPASGTLIDWRATQGNQVRRDQVVGRIQLQGGFVQPQMPIRAPADGTVAVDNGVAGTFVTAGTQLAIAYDPADVYVTARVDETEVDQVHTGAMVDISVDAFPNAGLTGHVLEIKGGAAGVFSMFPQSNSTGNFQKVTQVIPVKIGIDDLKSFPLAPGMNVTVKIHKS